MKHITIKDIARKLNISVSTVSRALNDKYDIKKETRDMILKTVEEMGYMPNPIARKLIQNRTYSVGVVVPEFLHSFFPETIMGMQEALLNKGYQLLIMPSNEDAETELKNVQTLVGNMVDGIIISLCKGAQNIPYYKKLLADGMPMVFFNRINTELAAPSVTFDDYKWAFFATEHLIRQGCKKPVHLSASFELPFAINRRKGFIDALKKHKIPTSDVLVIETGITIEKGEKIVEGLLNNGHNFDSILAANDLCAIGAMQAIKNHGLRIPHDIAVCGFTKTTLSQYVEPPLSTVEQPTFEMGNTAANLLLKLIDEPDEKITLETVVLNGRIIERSSSIKNK